MYLFSQGLPSRRFRGNAVAVLVLIAASLSMGGCNTSKPPPKGVAVVKNVNSKGLAKLSPTEIETRIKSVQADASIPESAKPGIIQGIRAQGEP